MATAVTNLDIHDLARSGRTFDVVATWIVTPLEQGVSMASVAGNALGFATGFIAGMRGRKADKGDTEAADGVVNKVKRFIPFL